MKIGSFHLEEYKKCFVIGEVGLNHEGSLGMAHAFIDAIASSGANAVKFQTHIAEAESTDREKFRVKVFPQDLTRFDYWRRTSFSVEQWAGLKKHAEEMGLVFLSSPFSIAAMELLESIGIEAWKVSSGDITNIPLLEKMCSTKKPLLVSTGMSPWEEIDACVDMLKNKSADFLLFQCNNSYPCPPEGLGLNILDEYRKRYNVLVGLSDHSARICSGIAAFALGAAALEVHVTLSKHAFGPDVGASLDIEELSELCSSIKFLEGAFLCPVNKDASASKMQSMRNLFMKGIVAAKNLPVGTIIAEEDLAYKKPQEGIPASAAFSIIGRRLICQKTQDAPIRWEDLQ
jgi:N-acetylneuraminate synthase